MKTKSGLRYTVIACGAILLAVTCAIAPVAYAQKKAGGGGPAGTIFFINGGSTNNTWSIEASGANTTFFGWYGNFQYPSRVLHGGYRYFISVDTTPGLYYADGTTVRREVFAFREDYNYHTNNNALTRIQLTDDPTCMPQDWWFSGMHWLSGDLKISYVAARWVGATIVDTGLFKADIAFGQDGLITGLTVQPVDPVITFPLSTLGVHSWSPDGSKFVYRDATAQGLWVADLTTGTRTQIYTGNALYPDWSPLNDRIVFSEDANIKTIRIDGSGVKMVLEKYFKWSGFGHCYYSADGANIICAGTINGGNGNSELVRVKSGGGTLTNVTNTLDIGEVPIAWRQ